MSRNIRLLASAVLLSVSAAWVAAAQDSKAGKPNQPAQADTEAYTASCIVRITCDPETIPLEWSIINAILQSAPVAGPAIREVLGSATYESDKIGIDIEPLAGGGTEPLVAKMTVQIDESIWSQTRPVAPKLLSSLCVQLEAALADATSTGQEHNARRRDRAYAQLNEATHRMAAVQELRQNLLQAAGTSDLARDRVLERIRALEGERDALQMDLAGEVATRNALEAQIAALGAKAAEKHTADDVAAELEKVVDLKTAEIRQMEQLVASGKASNSDLRKGQEGLAVARAELARQRQAALQSAGGELIVNLNGQLVNLTIKTAEAQARLKYATDQLAQIESKRLLATADQYEREVEIPYRHTESAYQNATAELAELESQLSGYQKPRVTVLGSKKAD